MPEVVGVGFQLVIFFKIASPSSVSQAILAVQMDIYAFLGWIGFGCITFLNILFAFAWKPFLAAYMGKKGERLATNEDIQKVLNEVRAVTRETEKIKAEISGDEWHRQWVINQKREIYREMLSVVNEMQGCYVVLFSRHADPVSGLTGGKSVNDARNDLDRLVQEFRKAQALALVFLSKAANQSTPQIHGIT